MLRRVTKEQASPALRQGGRKIAMPEHNAPEEEPEEEPQAPPSLDEVLFARWQSGDPQAFAEAWERLWRGQYKRAVSFLCLYLDQQLAEQGAQDAIQQAVFELEKLVTTQAWPGESSFDKLAWRRIWQRCIDVVRKEWRRAGRASPLLPDQAGPQPIGFLEVEGALEAKSCIKQLDMVSKQLGELGCEASQQTVDTWIVSLNEILDKQTVQHFAPEDLWEAVADSLSKAKDAIDQRKEQLDNDLRKVPVLPEWLENWLKKHLLEIAPSVQQAEEVASHLSGASQEMILRVVNYLKDLQQQGILWFDPKDIWLNGVLKRGLTREAMYQRLHRLRIDISGIQKKSIPIPQWIHHILGRSRQ